MENILVTGGAGYIGSVLVRILLARGYKVRVVDYFAFGGDSLLDVFSNPNLEIVRADIRDKSYDYLKSIDALCHLAAIVGDPACKKFQNDAREINADASIALYEECCKRKIKRFVFASTCSNYGKMADATQYLTETSELRPVSFYAELKVGFEKYLLVNYARHDIITTVLRFSTVYGLSPRMRFDLTVNEFTRDVTMGKELIIYGEQFWRPYCHVYDLASSMALTLEKDKPLVNGEVFNVGDTSENYNKKMLYESINNIVGNVAVKFVPQTDDPRDYKVDFSKIKNKLGFAITKKVPDGIREINRAIKLGIISNPYSERFSNT